MLKAFFSLIIWFSLLFEPLKYIIEFYLFSNTKDTLSNSFGSFLKVKKCKKYVFETRINLKIRYLKKYHDYDIETLIYYSTICCAQVYKYKKNFEKQKMIVLSVVRFDVGSSIYNFSTAE